MALKKEQKEHLGRLYYSLLTWYSKANGIAIPGKDRNAADEWASFVSEQIWGDFSDRSLFDGYVRDNPDRLGKKDLETVSTWRDAVHGTFLVLTQGYNSIFMLSDEYAFNVTPQSYLFEKLLSEYTPIQVASTLVPFEGKVTYVSLDMKMRADSDDPYVVRLTEALPAIEEKGNFIRNAFDLMINSERIADDKLAMEAEELLRTQQAYDEADGLAEGQHTGVLAGLVGEERERRVWFADHTQENMDLMLTLSILAERADDREGPCSLTDAYLTLGSDELRRLAREAYLQDASDGDLTALAYALADKVPLDIVQVFRKLVSTHSHAIDTIERVVAAGGSLEVSLDALRERPHLATPLFPYTLITKTGGKLYQVMPTEVYEAFRDIDWNRYVAREADVEARLGLIALAVDYRGIIRLDEILAEIKELMGPALAPGSLALAIRERGASGISGFIIANAPKHGTLVANSTYARFCRVDGYGDVQNTNPLMILDVFEKTEHSVSLSQVSETGGVVAATRREPAYQELVAWLDAHVPDGADDYHFATDTADRLVEFMRNSVDPRELSSVFYDMGLNLTDAQVVRMIGFIDRLARVVPTWLKGGRSLQDFGN